MERVELYRSEATVFLNYLRWDFEKKEMEFYTHLEYPYMIEFQVGESDEVMIHFKAETQFDTSYFYGGYNYPKEMVRKALQKTHELLERRKERVFK